MRKDIKDAHQGIFLRNYLKGKGLNLSEVAAAIGFEGRSGLYYQLSKPVLDKNFLHNLSKILNEDISTIVQNPTTLVASDNRNGQNHTSEGDRLRLKKAIGDDTQELGLVYVPIAAQAGYSRNFEDPIYVNQLERLYVPGLPYKGDKFRYFDVEGDSMFPTLEEGMQVIAERVNQEDWKHVSDYYIYVVVKINKIRVKRLFRKSEEQFVLISDNDFVKQELINTEDILELWLVKRMLDWRMAPPKRVQIDI